MRNCMNQYEHVFPCLLWLHPFCHNQPHEPGSSPCSGKPRCSSLPDLPPQQHPPRSAQCWLVCQNAARSAGAEHGQPGPASAPPRSRRTAPRAEFVWALRASAAQGQSKKAFGCFGGLSSLWVDNAELLARTSKMDYKLFVSCISYTAGINTFLLAWLPRTQRTAPFHYSYKQ